MPKLTNDANLFPGMEQKWGLGFLLNTAPGPNGRSACSLAWAGLANCYFWADTAQGVAGCLLTQMLPFADAAALDAVRRLRACGLRGRIDRIMPGTRPGMTTGSRRSGAQCGLTTSLTKSSLSTTACQYSTVQATAGGSCG